MKRNLLSITKEELSNYDGKNNKPAYVAVDGIIYDVSNISVWADGVHFGLTPGKDLSSQFSSCHDNDKNILSKLKIVGKLI